MPPRVPAAIRALPVLGALALGACQEAPKVPSLAPYRMDIQQGNIVTQEMIAKLKPGMTPAQVRFILGTPLVVDVFQKDRWDYVYRYSKGGKLQEARRIVIIFRDDKLARIEGDVVAGGSGGATEGGVRVEKPMPAEPGQPVSPAKAPVTGSPAAGAGKPAPESPGKPADTARPADTAKPADAATPAEDKAKSGEQPQEERGFFGRILERLGF
ncbi:MAG: outer membrane protein assembly factor BamE [Burkholderiales bacterium]|nr:outer membrane protein assembly factor BamE [Burkholderiales bacterium]